MNVLDVTSNFLALEEEYSTYDKSEIVIVSAPLEKTVSYGEGTVLGPTEILKASHYVEFYDDELDRELCFEKGICSLEELDISEMTSEKAIESIYEEVSSHLAKDKFVVTLGGEHALSLAPVKAHLEKFGRLTILQFDAHSDLRDSYEGSKYSHASVMARVYELTRDIVQVGIRAQCKDEADFIKENHINTFYAREIRTGIYGQDWKNEVLKKLGENVYITFDVDGFDPSVLAATGTPEPGGLFWDETMDILKLVGENKNIVGFDVVELAPSENHSHSNFVTAKLVYKMLNYAFIGK
ncbi:MAG: agmatinase [Bacteroidetes bacterium]|nr:agmatinase [Bacteroidota bacterium]